MNLLTSLPQARKKINKKTALPKLAQDHFRKKLDISHASVKAIAREEDFDLSLDSLESECKNKLKKI